MVKKFRQLYYANYQSSYHWLIIIIPFLIFINLPSVAAQPTSSQAVMLVLGSANPKILQHRVQVAYRLYHSQIAFQKIILSGGCGAHGSSICEASRMDSLLVSKGIPEQKIFKEEKSKTTKQNYCYSRKLSRQGKRLIRPTDHLYVVSSHWHAISVAACFRRADGLKKADYHIEGNQKPYGPADYTHIFKDCRKKNYCRAILWPLVDAAYYNRSTNKIIYFVDNMYYRRSPGHKIDPGYPKKINQYPGWPKSWPEHVDAAYYDPSTRHVILFSGTNLARITPEGTLAEGFPQKISHYFDQWPQSWGAGYIGAAYFDATKKELFLFRKSGYVQYKGKHLKSNSPADIKSSYPVHWPFQWGGGGVDAAFSNIKNDSVSLFRGTDFLRYSSSDHSIDQTYPKHVALPWPKNSWGARPDTN